MMYFPIKSSPFLGDIRSFFGGVNQFDNLLIGIPFHWLVIRNPHIDLYENP